MVKEINEDQMELVIVRSYSVGTITMSLGIPAKYETKVPLTLRITIREIVFQLMNYLWNTPFIH